MVSVGYTLLGEQVGPKQLIADAIRAERAGFDYAVVSDHFSPRLNEQGHAPYMWAVLGAVAHVTERIALMSMVTCPTRRYHPAIVAQKAATVALLSDGRFTLGLGAGERLNEHVVGDWPDVARRHDMLIEALEIIKPLLAGATVTHLGEYYQVTDARLYDRPERGVPLALAASGPESAQLAADFADGLITSQPLAEVINLFASAVGPDRPVYGQIPLCYGRDEAACRRTAYEQWRWGGLGWKVLAELPDTQSFAQVTEYMREDDVARLVSCGPDLDRHVEAVREYVRAGFSHVSLVQVGGAGQADFLDWAERDLLPALRDV
ncbi:MAG TPA: TIGR03557 family F420-dependent LLM class oxidoreductase [Micromonosporaceae bacterium]